MGPALMAREMNELSKIVLVILLLLVAEAFAGWTEPVNLGPMINTSGSESSPSLTADGRKLFFHGDNGYNKDDVLYSE